MTGGPDGVKSPLTIPVPFRNATGCCIDWRKSFCDFDRRGYLQAAVVRDTTGVGFHDARRCSPAGESEVVASYCGSLPAFKPSKRLVAHLLSVFFREPPACCPRTTQTAVPHEASHAEPPSSGNARPQSIGIVRFVLRPSPQQATKPREEATVPWCRRILQPSHTAANPRRQAVGFCRLAPSVSIQQRHAS